MYPFWGGGVAYYGTLPRDVIRTHTTLLKLNTESSNFHLVIIRGFLTCPLTQIIINHHHHHLPPWIRSFDLFRHRRIAIVSWGVQDLFFLEVCSRDAYFGSLVLSILSRWLIQFCLYLSLTSCIPEISSRYVAYFQRTLNTTVSQMKTLNIFYLIIY